METNKATMGVTAPCQGRIVELIVELQQSYPVGATLGFLEVDAEEAARVGLDTALEPAAAAAELIGELPERRSFESVATSRKAEGVQPTVRGSAGPRTRCRRQLYFPADEGPHA